MSAKKSSAKPVKKSAAKSQGASRPAKAAKYVYSFGAGRSDGDGSMRDLLGGKGANLGEMARIGLPVPPGFTITTEVCTHYYANKRTYPAVSYTHLDVYKRQLAHMVAQGEK